ncbi:hypothetical protein EDD21DRAFT_429977 [Dissophora ornata]|nr:hypothetical protein EDD21DRAFT_429977 [Dissophora ornata]
MSTDGKWQQLQYGNESFRVQVYPGVRETQEVPYVLLEDIKDYFSDAAKFMCGRDLVSLVRDANNNNRCQYITLISFCELMLKKGAATDIHLKLASRLMPLLFAYRPRMIVEIAKAEPSVSLSGVSQGSSFMSPSHPRASQDPSTISPRHLTRQNTILQSASVSSVEKDKLQQSVALYEDFVKSIKNGQREQAGLIRGDFQKCFSALQASMAKNHDLQREMSEMKQLTLQMQQQALDRLAVIQGRIQALLTQTYELHEYPIPRLLIILPSETSTWNSASIINNQFRLYFLCKCGEHTQVLSGDNAKIPHHIHLAKHEGYDLQRPKEFFQKYGSSKARNTISEANVNQAIEYLQYIVDKDSENHDLIKDTEVEPFVGLDALEGANLRHLETFIKSKDEHRVLGNLYRIVSHDCHVKLVCIGHLRSTYKEKEQQAFADIVEVNGGIYDPQLSEVVVQLGSKIGAAEFFGALTKARRVDKLDITFGWGFSSTDLKTLEKALKMSTVSILRLVLHDFQTGLTSKLLSTSTRYEILIRIIEHPNMKMIHIVLSGDFKKLSSLQPKRSSHLHKLSFEMKPRSIGASELRVIENSLKTNTTLTTLNWQHYSIGKEGALALSEALKTNTTLTTLNLKGNSIGNGALALSESLKTNTTLTTLDLTGNSIRKEGALALSEALKTNTTLTTLNLGNNLIGKDGALALSEALKTNTTLTALNLWNNSIEKEEALALTNVSKTCRCDM